MSVRLANSSFSVQITFENLPLGVYVSGRYQTRPACQAPRRGAGDPRCSAAPCRHLISPHLTSPRLTATRRRMPARRRPPPGGRALAGRGAPPPSGKGGRPTVGLHGGKRRGRRERWGDAVLFTGKHGANGPPPERQRPRCRPTLCELGRDKSAKKPELVRSFNDATLRLEKSRERPSCGPARCPPRTRSASWGHLPPGGCRGKEGRLLSGVGRAAAAPEACGGAELPPPSRALGAGPPRPLPEAHWPPGQRGARN